MNKLLIGLLACVLAASTAHAQSTKAQINTEITTTFPDNTVGAITPAGLRTVTADIVNSIMPTAPVVANNTVCFNGTTGLLKDCGIPPSLLIVGTTTVSSGISNGLLYNNGGILGNTVAANGGLLNTNALGAPAITATPVLGVAGSVLGTFGFQNLTSGTIALQPQTGALGASVLSLPAVTDTLVGKATIDTLTNKTYDTAGAGNSFSINGLAATANTGTGSVVRATSPTLVTPALGTPSAAILTNATGLPLGGLTAQGAFTFVGNNTSGSATPTAVDIAALTTKASPAAGDFVMISDQAASGAWKKATVSSVGSAGSVSSIAGNTGAFTLSGGVTNSVNDIRLSLNSAVLNGSPSDPTNTTSTTSVFMGLGVTTCRITPTYSSRVRFTIQGRVFNSNNASGTRFHIRYGTGAGPANGAAATVTGTALTTIVQSAGAIVPFTADGIATGLTPATAYWFDIALSVSADTGTVSSMNCVAQEVM